MWQFTKPWQLLKSESQYERQAPNIYNLNSNRDIDTPSVRHGISRKYILTLSTVFCISTLECPSFTPKSFDKLTSGSHSILCFFLSTLYLAFYSRMLENVEKDRNNVVNHIYRERDVTIHVDLGWSQILSSSLFVSHFGPVLRHRPIYI